MKARRSDDIWLARGTARFDVLRARGTARFDQRRARAQRTRFCARAEPRASSAGFTLIELMLALVAGSFVVVGAYYLSEVSARLFNEQVRRAETQMTLRSAGEQLRRDIGRAGFMAVRDSAELWGCNAAQVIAGGTGVEANNVRQQGVRVLRAAAGQPVQLFLTGNFTTSDQYPLDPSSNANTLALASQREGFRRSFVNPATGAFLPRRFLSAFSPDPDAPNIAHGRMVSIQDLSTGRVFLREILSVNAAPANAPQIVINPPLPTTGGCIPSFTTLVVAPISTVRYMLENPAGNPELLRAAGQSTLAGGNVLVDNATRLVLTRREIDMRTNGTGNPQPIPLTTRIVLDFVSSANGFNAFRIEGSFDANMNPPNPPLAPSLIWTAQPENVAVQGSLRSLLVELVASSAESTVLNAPTNDQNASRMRAGRRLLRMEVAMPNMARNPGTL
jgi:prepilin-type N-terminal cleavage/methylation domain-containing protein